MKRKHLRLYILVLIVVIITYAGAWGQMYFMANKYYNQAEDSLNSGKYIAALKGEKTPVFTTKGYTFKGGFQQVVDIYKSPWAFPKPPLYYKAEKNAEFVINEKLTAGDGYKLYNDFFGLDNQYLGNVLIRIGDIYKGKNNFKKAKKAYNTALESFPYNETVVNSAKSKIAEMEKESIK